MFRLRVLIVIGAAVSLASPAFAIEVGRCTSMSAMNETMRSENQRSLIVGDWMDYDGQMVSIGDTTMTRAEWMRVSRDIQSDTAYRRDLIAALMAKGRTQAQIDGFMAKLRNVSAILAKGDPNTPVPRHMMIFASNPDQSDAYIIVGDRPTAEASSQACVKGRFRNFRLARAEVLNSQGTVSDLITARGDVAQINGEKLTDVPIALRGSISDGDARVVVVQPGSPPLYMLEGIKVRPAAFEYAGR